MERILETVAARDQLTDSEKEGILGYSPLMDYPNFDFIEGVPVDYMHMLCIGVVKRLLQLTFRCGETRKRVTRRRLSNPTVYNAIVMKHKVPSEFSRRGRKLDLGVMKAEEFRNVVLFFFPIVLECIPRPEGEKERQLWSTLAFQVRAYILPDIEFKHVRGSQLQHCRHRFLTLFESLFGQSNCSYNVHMMGHLSEVRSRGPLTETSTFAAESYYGEMRNSYVPGTSSTGKQLLQNAYIKRQLPHDFCRKRTKFCAKDTQMSCNKYIYKFCDGDYHFFVIKKDLHNGFYECATQGRRRYRNAETPNLDWQSVGVFLLTAIASDNVLINEKDISGKAIVVMDLIITCPFNVLQE